MCTPPCEGVAPSGAPSGVLLRRRPRFAGVAWCPPLSSPAAPCGWRHRRRLGRARRPPSAMLLAGSSYWPPGGAPTPPGCVACSPRPRAPVRSTRAGATGSRPSWERTTIGILSYRNIVKRRVVGKDGARNKTDAPSAQKKTKTSAQRAVEDAVDYFAGGGHHRHDGRHRRHAAPVVTQRHQISSPLLRKSTGEVVRPAAMSASVTKRTWTGLTPDPFRCRLRAVTMSESVGTEN